MKWKKIKTANNIRTACQVKTMLEQDEADGWIVSEIAPIDK